MEDNTTQESILNLPPPGLKERLFSPLHWKSRFNRISAWIRRQVSDLTVSQWFYIIAGLLLVSSVDQDIESDSSLIWVGVFAGLGLSRELWHVFNRVWDNILGKAVVFVLYAATANFAVAVAALKVNEITGIEPSPFVFTLGFSTLLMLPFWLLVSSVVFFSIALILGNLWLIVSVLLRIIRIKVRVHWEDKSFVFLTMFLRVILIPYVIMTIMYIAVPFAEQIAMFEEPITIIKQAINEQDEADKQARLENQSEQTATSVDSSNNEIVVGDLGDKRKLTVDPEFAQILKSENTFGKGVYDKIIAGFIFHFETYPRSACIKAPNQRSLFINENLILLAEEDDSELGYKFSVGPCDGNFLADDEVNEPEQ